MSEDNLTEEMCVECSNLIWWDKKDGNPMCDECAENTIWPYNELKRLCQQLEQERARVAELEAALGSAINHVEGWCKQIDQVGTGWDDWDEWYKEAYYRGGIEEWKSALNKGGSSDS